MTTPPTIFISGWAHGAEVMRPLAAALGCAESARCLSPAELLAFETENGTRETAEDYRAGAAPVRAGPCSSVSVRDVALSPYAAALVARLRSSREPVTLVGWSTGGMIALEAALAAPEKVARLILLSATARFCATDGYACGLPAGNLRALTAGVARMPETALKGFFELAALPAVLDPEVAAEKVAVALGQGAEALKHGLAYLRECDLRAKLATGGNNPESLSHGGTAAHSNLTIPCLMIHGREDRVIPCGAAEFLAAALPDCRLVLLDGAGHDLPERHAARVAAAVENGR